MERIPHTNLLFKTLAFAAIMLGHTAPQAVAQPTDINNFCRKYSENARCENFVAISSETANTDISPSQVIRVQFDTTGSDREIVLIELIEKTIGDITLAAYHVEETEGFLQTLTNGAVGAVLPVPIPFDVIQVYNSSTSQTNFLAFTPDSCAGDPFMVNNPTSDVANCSVIGTDTIAFSEDVDIRSGAFTLRYTEGDLVRALTFRIGDHNTSFVGETDIDSLCENFPLNSRCRYWPISQAEE